ncbi:MAG: TIGR04283 family arsenosugar biosynthesis glycosyltransferase [Candidatus Polarisedimenticolaceae bacterium]|nr:TIGR04283 family arsenosugar biosynthesis glycosyltransferase [Candidatus Polarisedimenticolaceae bacterium]
MQNRLSIIIPSLNEAASIGRLLASLQPLRQAGHEVILVDGGSHDGTVQIAKPLVDQLLCSAAGRAKQMNCGAAAANGTLLWFVHADTELPAGAAELILNRVAAGAIWGRFDVRFSGLHPLLQMVAFAMNLRSRWTGIATGDQAIFVRRDQFDDLGGFPEIPLMEDIVLSKRLKRIGKPLCLHLKLTTSSRRWECRGICRTVVLMWWLRLAFALGANPKRLAGWYLPARQEAVRE